MPELLYTYVMKQVVVLGGGVAGMRVVVALSKVLPRNSITLVDRLGQHELPFASLLVSPTQHDGLTKNSIEFSKLAQQFGFVYVRGMVQGMDMRERMVKLENRTLSYDYAVLALGSSQTLLPDHTVSPVNRAYIQQVHHMLQFALQRQRHATTRQPLTIAVVGGGLVGVSAAAQLTPFVHSVAREHNFPIERIRIVCFEQQGRLLPAHAYEVGRAAEYCLHALGVEVRCYTAIAKVEQSYVSTVDGMEWPVDGVIWAAGWKAQDIRVEGGMLPIGSRNQILVNNKFQTQLFPNIFCVGDQASPPFPHRHGAVRETLAEAEYVASILPRVMQNMRVNYYVPRNHAEYVPLGSGKALRILRNSAQTGLLARMGLRRAGRKYRSVLGV